MARAATLADTDELARRYTARAERAGSGAEDREAAALFSIAESHLNGDEAVDEALKAAIEALAVFRAAGDSEAVVDTLRLIVHAHNARAELLRFASGAGPGNESAAQEALLEAERLALAELEQLRRGSDRRSIGAMLLSLAEVRAKMRTAESCDEACKAALEARALFRELGDSLLEGSAAYVLVNVYLNKLQIQHASEAAREALELFQRAGDQKREGKCLHLVAMVHMLQDRFQDAMAAAERSLAIFRDLRLPKMVAFELYSIANWCLSKEKAKFAVPYAREASEVFKDLDYGKGWKAASLALLIQALVQSGDVQRGLMLGKQALAEFEEEGDLRGKVFACDALVHAQLCQQDQNEALVTATGGLEACRSLGDRRWEAQMLRTVSSIHSHSKDWEKAAQAAQDAQALSQEIGDKTEEAETCGALVRLHVAQGGFKSALAAAEAQHEIFLQTGERAKEAQSLLVRSRVKGMDADLVGAMQDAQQAREVYQELGDVSGEAGTLILIGDVYLASEEFAAALDAANEALRRFQESKQLKMQAQALGLAAKVHLAEKNEPMSALKCAQEAVALARASDDSRLVVEMLILASQAQGEEAMANAASARDDQGKMRAMERGGDKAHKLAQEAVGVAKKLRDPGLIASSVYAVASAHLVAYRCPQALSAADDAVLKFQALGDTAGQVAATLVRAEVHVLEGKPEKATEVATRAMAMAQACKDKDGEYRAYLMLQQLREDASASGGERFAMAARPAAGVAAEALVEEAPGLDPEVVMKMVLELVKGVLGGDEDVHTDSPLMDTGMDSLSSVAFRNDLQKSVGFSLGAALIFDYPTPRALVSHLVEVSKTKK